MAGKIKNKNVYVGKMSKDLFLHKSLAMVEIKKRNKKSKVFKYSLKTYYINNKPSVFRIMKERR